MFRIETEKKDTAAIDEKIESSGTDHTKYNSVGNIWYIKKLYSKYFTISQVNSYLKPTAFVDIMKNCLMLEVFKNFKIPIKTTQRLHW